MRRSASIVVATSWQRAWPLSMPRLRSSSPGPPCCFCAAPASGSQARSSMATSRTGRSISRFRSDARGLLPGAVSPGQGDGRGGPAGGSLLVGLVVILTLGVPIRMAGRGLLALLNRAPDQAVVASVEALASGALTGLAAPRLLRARPSARSHDLRVGPRVAGPARPGPGRPPRGPVAPRGDRRHCRAARAGGRRHHLHRFGDLAAPTTGFVGAGPHGAGAA